MIIYDDDQFAVSASQRACGIIFDVIKLGSDLQYFFAGFRRYLRRVTYCPGNRLRSYTRYQRDVPYGHSRLFHVSPLSDSLCRNIRFSESIPPLAFDFH